MAGAGYKLFSTGDVLTAAQVNTYLMQQTVMVFANASARTTALSGVLAEGMLSYLQDTNKVYVYDGSAWLDVSSEIPSQTGNSGKYLTTDGTNASWATVSGGGMTLLSTTTLSGATTTISSISQSYKHLYVEINSQTNATASGKFRIAPNGDTSYCDQVGQYLVNGGSATAYEVNSGYIQTATNVNYNFQETRNKFCITFFDYTSTSQARGASGVFNYYASNNAAVTSSVTAQYQNNTAISSLVFSNSGGNQTGGTVKIYGVN